MHVGLAQYYTNVNNNMVLLLPVKQHYSHKWHGQILWVRADCIDLASKTHDCQSAWVTYRECYITKNT